MAPLLYTGSPFAQALCVEDTKVETDCSRRSNNLSSGGLESAAEEKCAEADLLDFTIFSADCIPATFLEVSPIGEALELPFCNAVLAEIGACCMELLPGVFALRVLHSLLAACMAFADETQAIA